MQPNNLLNENNYVKSQLLIGVLETIYLYELYKNGNINVQWMQFPNL